MSISVSRGMPNVACAPLHFAYKANSWTVRISGAAGNAIKLNERWLQQMNHSLGP